MRRCDGVTVSKRAFAVALANPLSYSLRGKKVPSCGCRDVFGFRAEGSFHGGGWYRGMAGIR
jgi:hypothetical protein